MIGHITNHRLFWNLVLFRNALYLYPTYLLHVFVRCMFWDVHLLLFTYIKCYELPWETIKLTNKQQDNFTYVLSLEVRHIELHYGKLKSLNLFLWKIIKIMILVVIVPHSIVKINVYSYLKIRIMGTIWENLSYRWQKFHSPFVNLVTNTAHASLHVLIPINQRLREPHAFL